MLKTNQNALILGAYSKVGTSICNFLESKSINVYRQGLKNRQVKNYHVVDLSHSNKIQEFFSSLPNRIDLFISCIGGNRGYQNNPQFIDNATHTHSVDIEWIFRMNFFANLACIPFLINKKCKRIIFIGSDVVGKPRDHGRVAVYACAKAALHEYTLHLSNELKDCSVNCLSPGGINAEKLAEINQNIDLILNDVSYTGNVIRI